MVNFNRTISRTQPYLSICLVGLVDTVASDFIRCYFFVNNCQAALLFQTRECSYMCMFYKYGMHLTVKTSFTYVNDTKKIIFLQGDILLFRQRIF